MCRQHPTREPMRTLRIGERRQQFDGAARPVHHGGAADRDTGVEKTLMLTIQRKMPAVFEGMSHEAAAARFDVSAARDEAPPSGRSRPIIPDPVYGRSPG